MAAELKALVSGFSLSCSLHHFWGSCGDSSRKVFYNRVTGPGFDFSLYLVGLYWWLKQTVTVNRVKGHVSKYLFLLYFTQLGCSRGG